MKLKQFLAQIWTLIKIKFKSRVAIRKEKSTKEWVKFGFLVATLVAVFGVFIFLYYLFAGQFIDPDPMNDLSREFLIFTILLFQIIQTVFLIPSLLRQLDINNERELLMKLPVSHKQIFASKIIVAYLLEILFATIILLPILIAFGIASNMHWGFFLYIPLVLVFAPAIPFFIASIVLYPVMKLVQIMKSRALLTSLGFFFGLVAAMSVYILVMNMIVGQLVSSGNFRATLNDNMGVIQHTASRFFPQALFANMVGGVGWLTALWSFFALLGMSGFLFSISYIVGGFAYKHTYQNERTNMHTLSKENNFKQSHPTKATFVKEVKNISRSSNYTFQLFLIVIITPLIVFFIDRISSFTFFESVRMSGQAEILGNIGFAIAMFVLLILLPLSASFAASNITREGHNVYHTKLIPQSFFIQVMAKFFVVFIPIAASVFVTVAILMIPYQPDPNTQIFMNLGVLDAFYMLFVSLCMTAGYVALGTYLDIKRPLANQVGEGELQRGTPNITFVMVLGLVIGVFVGTFMIFGNFVHFFEHASGFVRFVSTIGRHMRWIFLGFASVFALAMCWLLFIDGPRKYGRLEQ